MTAQPERRLKLALFGLGRLGAIRARILASQQPRIDFVAACDNKPGAAEWAAANLPASVKFYADPEECMRNSGAEAILISTATATHAPLIHLGLDLGLHVMCEKPISVDVLATQDVISKALSKPELKFLVPFSRRYDRSYRHAKQLVEDGSLGEIHAVETCCIDQQDPTGFFVTFSAQSGGIFVDMGIHDIDIGRYFLDVKANLPNPKKQVNRVIAMGQQAVYGDLAKYGDCDNGWGMVEFANGKILTTHLGRTLTNGYEGATRVCGTKAHSVIGGNSTIDRVEIRDQYGVRAATTPDAFTLYDTSFINDLEEFAGAVLDNAPMSCSPEDAFEAAKIVTALQHSFRTRMPVYFDDSGLPIMDAIKA
ncbi:NAD binding Rossmann fold oxidoreductase [Leptodontidium sp. 2 PMI_412]|nr:NAD binding Rossmann fold oxidoreductase [Leptodontidium sp. MPI-SDFR-AT-0119]KAH9219567.1 NAD binding Rossmann fold oxidoreductase [Leptodontidium sp. 2 PMI_412]